MSKEDKNNQTKHKKDMKKKWIPLNNNSPNEEPISGTNYCSVKLKTLSHQQNNIYAYHIIY
jgi:CRISPR/Cas system-associated protein Cas10 (large subunit of type III CRISPR-Cas system)